MSRSFDAFLNAEVGKKCAVSIFPQQDSLPVTPAPLADMIENTLSAHGAAACEIEESQAKSSIAKQVLRQHKKKSP